MGLTRNLWMCLLLQAISGQRAPRRSHRFFKSGEEFAPVGSWGCTKNPQCRVACFHRRCWRANACSWRCRALGKVHKLFIPFESKHAKWSHFKGLNRNCKILWKCLHAATRINRQICCLESYHSWIWPAFWVHITISITRQEIATLHIDFYASIFFIQFSSLLNLNWWCL